VTSRMAFLRAGLCRAATPRAQALDDGVALRNGTWTRTSVELRRASSPHGRQRLRPRARRTSPRTRSGPTSWREPRLREALAGPCAPSSTRPMISQRTGRVEDEETADLLGASAGGPLMLQSPATRARLRWRALRERIGSETSATGSRRIIATAFRVERGRDATGKRGAVQATRLRRDVSVLAGRVRCRLFLSISSPFRRGAAGSAPARSHRRCTRARRALTGSRRCHGIRHEGVLGLHSVVGIIELLRNTMFTAQSGPIRRSRRRVRKFRSARMCLRHHVVRAAVALRVIKVISGRRLGERVEQLAPCRMLPCTPATVPEEPGHVHERDERNVTQSRRSANEPRGLTGGIDAGSPPALGGWRRCLPDGRQRAKPIPMFCKRAPAPRKKGGRPPRR